MQFRPYQSEYVDNIALNKSNLLVAPMRSGKSLIMTGIIDKYFKDQFVLIIVGMRNVILQLSDYYADHTFILAGKDFDHSKHIQLATFQTFGRRSIDLTQYAAVFVDEAHMRFNTDLVKQIRDLTCTRVFFTGTPLFPNNKRMNQHVDNVLQHITVEEMINSNYLAPTRFMAVGNMLKDESELSTQNGDYLNEDIDRIIDKQALIQWIVVDNIKYEWSSKHKTIMYTNSIATAERISAAFNSPDVRIIHSKLTSKQMDATMEWFHSTPNGIIINCRMLTVGVDIPSADTIVYLLPTKIHSLYLQSIFRASTVFGDKVATVYDYSGMLGKVNPYTDFSEYSKKLSCKEECAKSYPNDPLAQYFCLESCTSNPILIQCNGELPVSYINNPIISNFQVHKGTPCLEAHPVYRMEYKQTEPSPGMIRKWCKCKCGCVTSYDVKTLTEPADIVKHWHYLMRLRQTIIKLSCLTHQQTYILKHVSSLLISLFRSYLMLNSSYLMLASINHLVQQFHSSPGTPITNSSSTS